MFIAKARAYEGLGNLALAETLVLAYGELLGGLDGRVEALALLERLRAAREVVEAPAARERRPRTRRVVAEPVLLAPPEKLDPAPYRERVLAALAEGQCNAAQSAASELTMTAPEVAEGWRMAGDAARCSGDLRGGLLAYRRYVHQGGEEASTLAMIERVAAMFGTLLVRVEAPTAAAPVRARIPIGQVNTWSEPTPEGLLRLRDLPTDQPFSLTVSGRGLRPLGARVEPLKAGEVRELTLAPEWLGLATVTVPSTPDGVRVVLLTEDAEIQAEPGETYTISAAEAYAQVVNEFGAVVVPLDLASDANVSFDPSPWLPARLAVVGLPAGSSVRVAVDNEGVNIDGPEVVLPAEIGELDLDTGVRVAPVRHLDSLMGGVGTLVVQHPTLGSASAPLVVETGKLNAVTFDWRAMPGVSSAVEGFAARQAEVTLVKRAQGRTAVLGIVSGVLAGVGAGLLAGSLVQQGVADAARDEAVAGYLAGDSAGLTKATAEFKAARDLERVLGVGSGVGFGLAGVGFAVTLGSAQRPR